MLKVRLLNVAEQRRMNEVKRMRVYEADVDCVEERVRKPLQLAVRAGSVDIVQFLIGR